MPVLPLGQVQPDEADVRAAATALGHVENHLHRHPRRTRARLVVDDEALVLPRAALELLAQVLAHLAAGTGVAVVPTQAELTTQQAADLLNVSRPYLIGLLDAGHIPYRKVGTHRRVRAAALLDYLRADDQLRRDAADELSALTRQLGLV